MMLIFFPMLFYRIIKSKKNLIVNLSLALFAFIFIGVIDMQAYSRKTSVVNVVENAGLEREISFYKKAILQSASVKSPKLEQLNSSIAEFETLAEEYQKKILGDEENIYRHSIKLFSKSKMDAFFDNEFSTLKTALQKVHAEALLLANNDALLKVFITEKLSTDSYDIDVYGEITWQKQYFYGSGGEKHIYINLNKLVRNIYQVQYEVLRAMN